MVRLIPLKKTSLRFLRSQVSFLTTKIAELQQQQLSLAKTPTKPVEQPQVQTSSPSGSDSAPTTQKVKAASKGSSTKRLHTKPQVNTQPAAVKKGSAKPALLLTNQVRVPDRYQTKEVPPIIPAAFPSLNPGSSNHPLSMSSYAAAMRAVPIRTPLNLTEQASASNSTKQAQKTVPKKPVLPRPQIVYNGDFLREIRRFSNKQKDLDHGLCYDDKHAAYLYHLRTVPDEDITSSEVMRESILSMLDYRQYCIDRYARFGRTVHTIQPGDQLHWYTSSPHYFWNRGQRCGSAYQSYVLNVLYFFHAPRVEALKGLYEYAKTTTDARALQDVLLQTNYVYPDANRTQAFFESSKALYVVHQALQARIETDPSVREALLNTCDRYLMVLGHDKYYETATIRMPHDGARVLDFIGCNWLGVLLMRIREHLWDKVEQERNASDTSPSAGGSSSPSTPSKKPKSVSSDGQNTTKTDSPETDSATSSSSRPKKGRKSKKASGFWDVVSTPLIPEHCRNRYAPLDSDCVMGPSDDVHYASQLEDD